MSVVRASLLSILLVGCTTATESSSEPLPDPVRDDVPVVTHDAPLKKERPVSRNLVDEPICTLLPLTSDDVAITRVASDLAPATGGDLAPGTYDLVRDVVYTGAGGDEGTATQAFAQTIRISDDRLEATSREKGIGTNGSGRYVATGTTLATMESCPEPGHFQAFHYTATPSELAIHIGGGEVLVYSKR
jgi:hypothetical protein